MKHLKGPRALSDLCHIQIITGYKNFLLTILCSIRIKLKSFECEDYPTGCNPKLVQQRNHKALPMNYTILNVSSYVISSNGLYIGFIINIGLYLPVSYGTSQFKTGDRHRHVFPIPGYRICRKRLCFSRQKHLWGYWPYSLLQLSFCALPQSVF